MFGSSVLPDLLDTMNSVRGRSTESAMRRICAGSVESTIRSRGKPGLLPKLSASTSAQRLEPPMPSSSASLKSPRLTSAANASRWPAALSCSIDDRQPAEPVGLVGLGPQRGVAGPQPPHLALLAPVFERRLDPVVQLLRQLVRHRVELAAEHRAALLLHRRIELVGRVGEQSDAVLDQPRRDLVDRDAGFRQRVHHGLRAGDILFEAGARRAVIAERIHRRRRHRVDRIRADQLLDIQHVAVGRVLGAGAGP